MADADPMVRVRELLAESRAAVNDGRDLIERGVALRGEAFDALPVGAVMLHEYPPPGEVYAVQKAVSGDWFDTRGPCAPGWVWDEWQKSNWRVVDESGT